MDYKIIAVLVIVGFAGTLLSTKLIKGMLVDSNVIRPNYKNEMIPICMGISFLPMLVVNTYILEVYFNNEFSGTIFLYLFSIVAMLMVGLLDDLVGTTTIKGLKGHFKALSKGTLTTGGLKALTGGAVGLAAGIYIGGPVYEIIISALIVALSTNFMNLLDLRPGRAIKVYLLVSIIFLFILHNECRYLILMLLPCVLAYFRMDLKAQAMMGDTGSNVLGVSIGLVSAYGLGFTGKIIWLVILAAIHILTEKYSLSKIIEKNSILKKIDMLGRD